MKQISLWLIILFSIACNKSTINSKYVYLNKFTYKDVEVPLSSVNCNCHTQGVGWHNQSNSIIVTCEGDNEGILSRYKLNNGRLEFVESLHNNAGRRNFAHPSAIQVYGDIIPVAISNGKRDSSFVYFYEIKNNEFRLSSFSPIKFDKHIGALGITKWNNNLYLIGLGWHSKYYALWKSSSAKSLDFKLIAEGSFDSITKNDFGAYNAVWFGMHNAQLTLFATYGSFYSKRKNFLDIYKVEIEDSSIGLNLLNRNQVKGITNNTLRSLFFEGVTIKQIKNDTIEIFSAPQDFKKGKYYSALRYLYEGVLILK